MSSASSSQFVRPYPIDLTFFTKASWLKSGHRAVTGINGEVIFRVESHSWSLRSKQVVFDASGRPVISMKEKLLSLHDRWQVFTGDSWDPKHLLLTVKRSSVRQSETETLDVFLAGNTKEEMCDYKIKGSYKNRSCAVYRGDSSMVVAQMSKEHKCASSSQSKNAFGVAVSADTDCSFITAMVIILRELHKQQRALEIAQGVLTVVGTAGDLVG